jgi:hypothetical protein
MLDEAQHSRRTKVSLVALRRRGSGKREVEVS